jgi:hypothetical protein
MARLGMSWDGSVGSARDGSGCRDGLVGLGWFGTAQQTYKIQWGASTAWLPCMELRGASDDVFGRVKP